MKSGSTINPPAQSGLALVTVLLIVALIASLQVFLIEQQHLLIRMIGNQKAAEQSFQYAQGINTWATRVLYEDANPAIDYWGEDWYKFGKPVEQQQNQNVDQSDFSLQTTRQAAEEEEPMPQVDFGIEGLKFEIQDLQSRFNLNNLEDKNPAAMKAYKTIFLNLLEILQIGEIADREQLYGALLDWLDENDLASASGYESGDYQIKTTPYYSADQKLTSLGELRFVEGFTAEVISKLRPYVTALPINNAKINLNTASAEVVAALSAVPVTDLGSISAFLSEREEEAFLGFQSADIQRAESAIIGASVIGKTPVPNMLQTFSQFFSVNAHISLGDHSYCTRTVVMREAANPDDSAVPGITIIGREHDTFCVDSQTL
ncbi:MAG: type II secretion system minor pseudopilin GspK [Arenicella sp.]|nr:type II secretion system minor pseudopilin GspK [Arenicella sp.]